MSSQKMHPTGYPPTNSSHSQQPQQQQQVYNMQHLVMHAVAAAPLPHQHAAFALPVGTTAQPPPLARPKRLCRFPGCTKVIKSQGHCQRHGARSKRCRVDGCEKQAQGTHDGMCKRHWKAHNFPEEPAAETEVLEPVGESAYDSLLPRSIAYRPVPTTTSATTEDGGAAADGAASATASNKTLMPLVVVLKEGAETKEPGWHRNAERAARGLPPVDKLSDHMESWEKQLALFEILLLSGGTPQANFRHLAHAWGRDRGFHHVLINTICERRGEIDRKRRSDAREFTLSTTTSPRKKRGTSPENGVPIESVYFQAVGLAAASEDDQGDESSPKAPTQV